MPTTVLTGVVDDNMILQNQRQIDMDDEITQVEPDEAQLMHILMRMPTKPATSQKFEWLEDDEIPRLVTIGTAITSVASTIVAVGAGEGPYLRPRDVLRVASTAENLAVTAVSGDTVGVTRSIGAVAAATAAVGGDVVRIGNAAAEGATLGTLKQTRKVAQYNYCQIQRDPFGMTNTALASKLYGGDEIAYQANKALVRHKRQLDMTAWFGQRDLDVSGSAPIAYAGGVLEYITSNVMTATTITEITWETFLRTAFRYGNKSRKIAFVSPLVKSAISNFALADNMNSKGSGENEWGVSIDRYVSGAGARIDLVTMHDWMDFQTASPGFGGMAIILDMDHIRRRPLRNTVLEPNRQANDEDSKKQEYLTEQGYQIRQEKAHAVLRGITAYA